MMKIRNEIEQKKKIDNWNYFGGIEFIYFSISNDIIESYLCVYSTGYMSIISIVIIAIKSNGYYHYVNHQQVTPY